MAITNRMLCELASARIPLVKLAQLTADDKAEIEITKLAIHDPLNYEFIVGYQLVISVVGAFHLIEDIEKLVIENVNTAQADEETD